MSECEDVECMKFIDQMICARVWSEEVMKSVLHMKHQQRDSLIYGSFAGTFLMLAKLVFILGTSRRL